MCLSQSLVLSWRRYESVSQVLVPCDVFWVKHHLFVIHFEPRFPLILIKLNFLNYFWDNLLKTFQQEATPQICCDSTSKTQKQKKTKSLHQVQTVPRLITVYEETMSSLGYTAELIASFSCCHVRNHCRNEVAAAPARPSLSVWRECEALFGFMPAPNPPRLFKCTSERFIIWATIKETWSPTQLTRVESLWSRRRDVAFFSSQTTWLDQILWVRS